MPKNTEAAVLQEGAQIRMADADKPQLVAFMRELAVPFVNFDNADQLRKRLVESGYSEAFIIDYTAKPKSARAATPKVAASVAAPAAKAVAPAGDVQEPTFEITIQTTEGSGGKRPIFVAVNGKGILIPRNKRSVVKRRYIGAIEIAIEEKFAYDEDVKAVVGSDVPSYPYQIHRSPSDEACAAYDRWYAEQERRDTKQKAA